MPLVLVLSDLHWATDDTLELCERLLTRLRNLPFVLVATARPDIETRWTPEPGKYNGITLQLDPLDEHATGELVRALLDGDADPRDRHAPARTQRRQPVLHRRARRVHAGVGRRRRASAKCRPRCTACSRPGSTRSTPPSVRCSKTARSSAPTGRSPPCSALADRSRRAAAARPARRARPHRARRRRVPLQVGPDPRDRVRHAHQGRARPPPRARSRRCSKRAARPAIDAGRRITSRPRPSSSPSWARCPAFPPTSASRRSPRSSAPPTAPSASSRGSLFGRHHDRALGLLPDEPGPTGGTRCSGGARPRVQQRRHRRRPRRPAHRARRSARGRRAPLRRPRRSRCSATAEIAVGAYDVAEETFGEALELLARARRRRGRRRRAARARRVAPLPRRSRASRALRVGGARVVPLGGQSSAARRGRCRTSRGSRSSSGDIPHAEERLQRVGRARSASSATGAGSAGPTGCSRSSATTRAGSTKPPTLAEHIAIEGRETGNRWAVGMMNVLLAQRRAVERPDATRASTHGREAIALFQEIGDRWGEVMATGPVVRALAELGRDGEYADTLAHYRTISRDMPDEGMRTFPEVLESLVDLQQGRPEAAQAILDTLEHRRRRRQRSARLRRRQRRGRARRCCSSARSTTRSTSSHARLRRRRPKTAR